MQIKTAMRYHCTCTRMAKMRDKPHQLLECGQIGTFKAVTGYELVQCFRKLKVIFLKINYFYFWMLWVFIAAQAFL